MMVENGKKKIGELLVEEGYVTPEQVEHGLRVQKTRSERICNILMDLGYLSEESFVEFLSAIPGTASIELQRCEIEFEILNLIPRKLALKLEVVPIDKFGKLLTVAMVCPLDNAGLEELEAVTNLKVKPILCSPASVHRALERYYKEAKEIRLDEEAEEDYLTLTGPLQLQRVAKLMDEIEELPTLPDILTMITGIVNDPNSSAADLAEVISRDGALSAKILKLANSAAYGFSREVSSIKHAIALLGFRETRALSLSVCTLDYLMDKAEFDFTSYWNHSYACASLTRLICVDVRSPMVEDAFVAGLLHDMGKILLAMSMHGKQKKATSLHSTGEMDIIEAEEKVFGITHAEAGYLLGEHWLLPALLINGIRHHHKPELEPPPKGLASIVLLANSFCQADTTRLDDGSIFNEMIQDALTTIGMSEKSFLKTLETYDNMASDIISF